MQIFVDSFIRTVSTWSGADISGRYRKVWRGVFHRAGSDESGQVMMLFALMLLPMLVATGAVVDYSRRNAAKTRLDAALDSAILSVITQKSNSVFVETLSKVEVQFRTEAAKIPDVKITNFISNPIVNDNTLSLESSYTATVDTTLGRLAGVANMNISGAAATTRDIFKYIDFYLLLDNSPSMGLAATDADVSKMQAVTPRRCAFACHEHTFDNRGRITGDKTDDYYQIAKRNNIRLRIDVLRDSVANLVDSAKKSMSLPNQYRMELWTFSRSATLISSLSTHLDRTKSDSAKIDLEYSLYNDPDNQTSYEPALAKLTEVMPRSGDGLTPATPVRFLFFVTDGVQDTFNNVSAGTEGKQVYGGNRWIGPINPATCNALKVKNVRIGIIYTTYMPIPSDGFYRDFVQPYESKIPANLQSCASDGLFFPVSTGGDINAAMQQLFKTSLASVRITN